MFDSTPEIFDSEHNVLVDDRYIRVIIQLRELGLFTREDICNFNLIIELCKKKYYAEKRFHFLPQFNSYALTRPDSYGRLPLHYAAINITTSIQEFQVVFEYGIRYYPNKKGINLLFKKSNTGATPFFMACVASGYALHGWKDNVEWTPLTTAGFHHGRDIVMNVIEETLLDCQRRSDDNNNNNTGPYNIVDALITAAIDEGVHLDYVYFLLRRHPDVLIQLLSSTSVAVAGPNNTNNGGGGDDDGNNRRVGTDITSATASNYIIDADSELSVKQQQVDNINENEGRNTFPLFFSIDSLENDEMLLQNTITTVNDSKQRKRIREDHEK